MTSPFSHAGVWADSLTDDRGNSLKLEAFTVTDPANGNAAVTIYTDRSKATVLAGMLYSDQDGNAVIYADPGFYTGTVPRTGKTFPIQVPVAEEDINTSVVPNVAHLTGTEIFTGAKDFEGGLTKGGVQVATSADVAAAGLGGTYIFHQSSPQTTWNVVHNLGKFPGVTTTDNSGNVVIGDVVYINNNSVNVSFSLATAGVAYLN